LIRNKTITFKGEWGEKRKGEKGAYRWGEKRGKKNDQLGLGFCAWRKNWKEGWALRVPTTVKRGT